MLFVKVMVKLHRGVASAARLEIRLPNRIFFPHVTNGFKGIKERHLPKFGLNACYYVPPDKVTNQKVRI